SAQRFGPARRIEALPDELRGAGGQLRGELLVSQNLLHRLDPFRIRARRERGPPLDAFSLGAHGRGDRRNTSSHILGETACTFPSSPGIIKQRGELYLQAFKGRHFDFRSPLYGFDLKRTQIPYPGRYDANLQVGDFPSQRLEWPLQTSQIGHRSGQADPTD